MAPLATLWGRHMTKVSKGVIGAMYWVPLADVDPHRVREQYTVEKRGIDYMTGKPTYEAIEIFRENDPQFPGMIGLPIADGMQSYPTDNIIEALSDGVPFMSWTRRPDPDHPLAAPGQREFMAETTDALDNLYTVLAKAQTGSGKTVVALDQAARLGVRTLVLVPLSRLKDQWIKQIEQHLGVPRSCIGEVVGPKCQWGRDIVVGMMKSVAMREYPPEFYKAFGFVVYDETHNLGAFMSARTQGRFNARYKLAITATDVRRDGGDRVYHSYFGKPAFVRSMQAVDTEVQVLSYTSKKPPTGTKKASKLLALAHDFERNKIISDIARKWYREGHCPLFVTDHVHHAEILYKMFMASGIPENKIGLYTGGQTVDGVMSTTTKEYLDWAEKHASVFIATFGMMKEGIDIPKLDRGMDCTPRSDFEQVLGRIRRAYPGKTKAVWVTIRDRAVKSFEGAYFQRISSVNKLPNITVKKVELAHVLGP